MADMFADRQLTSYLIRRICDDPKKFITDEKGVWFSYTKLMFENFPAVEVYNLVEQALSEVSDKQWFEKKYPMGLKREDWIYPKKKKSVIKINLKKSRIKKLIDDNLKIIDVAKNYRITVKGNKCICPFHDDKNPSLVFYPKTNSFNCFGCNAKGDIIEFKRRMKRWEKEMKQQKNS